MSSPRILLTRRWPAHVERAMAAEFDVIFNENDQPMSQKQLAEAMREVDILCPTVSDRIDAEVIGEAPKVKLIANYGVGFDHIDLSAAKSRGVAVSNTPGVLTQATADIAFTLLLMAARRAGEGERELRAGKWTGWRPTHLMGASLAGKTLGLVGFGRIAQAVARRAHHGFGMKIAYYGRREAEPEIAQRYQAQFHENLHSLLRISDAVSLHVPGGAETRHLIDSTALKSMRPHAYLVNTARGEVVDHTALTNALENKLIAGAGLDVYPEEPSIPKGLTKLENVVLLPHLGSATNETRIAMGMKALANVEAFLSGKPLPDPVLLPAPAQ
ncbi:2-hydroxyacid dehydrogenase [Altericroceibacterium endophyticum]|uniref:D-glycerate dehydrogenase n=1 Tax=Altericroceibacterium endophyticum TaxID=1808508 RepID=A0A6I4T5L9_9SPHN|nr:D-glycerate dehydrogenase [Altericroceibacterium endophyticum]MXO66147.1 D-glycerate dehydrogenase [Altericroceibacterium endophyticum]